MSHPPTDPQTKQLAPLTTLRGIGPKTAAKLAERGLHVVGDLLTFLPLGYRDLRRSLPLDSLFSGEDLVTSGFIVRVKGGARLGGRRRSPLEVQLAMKADGKAVLCCIWYAAPSWLVSRLEVGQELTVAGRVEDGKRHLQMVHPELGADESLARVRPRYPVVEGVGQRLLHDICLQALKICGHGLPETLSSAECASLGVPSLREALRCLHVAQQLDAEEVATLASEHPARRRLVVEELVRFEMGLCCARRERDVRVAYVLTLDEARRGAVAAALPFALTGAQSRVIDELLADCGTSPMNRLLIGDVGSGKTVVALFAAMAAIASGFHAIMLVPTGLLARQHATVWRRPLAALGVPLAVLSGDAPLPELGEPTVLVGTHVLLHRADQLRKVGLVAIDEQHRFGVEQRRRLLRGAGRVPHLLLMSATPIPRSLALLQYGEMDVSLLDDSPGPRVRPETRWLREARLEQGSLAAAAVDDYLHRGQQVIVVCPRLEASAELSGVLGTARRLGALWPDVGLSVVHGELDGEEQDAAMARFRRGEHRILVATTVVEVGLDVPGVGMMVIEAADRFGIAQLHQLRGRIGRGVSGGAPPRCLLLSVVDAESTAGSRLRKVEAEQNGFALAQFDLISRGPGELLGSRQSGPLPLRLTDLRRADHLALWGQARDLVMGRNTAVSSRQKARSLASGDVPGWEKPMAFESPRR